jgi:hypothetical protein
VLAENLGATVVQITARQFVLYRGRRGEGAIELPKEGETSILVAELSVSLGQLSDSIQVRSPRHACIWGFGRCRRKHASLFHSRMCFWSLSLKV